MSHPPRWQQDIHLQGHAIRHLLVSLACPLNGSNAKEHCVRYHSHFSVQYGNGIVGAIQINGPASADYDYDLGPYVITDWYHKTADLLQLEAEVGFPPQSDNILFNGTNIGTDGVGGAYNKVKLTPNKKHRIRIVNPSSENHFTVSLVGHTFTVIATDLVPVKPVVRSQLFLGLGQRYDVIVEANQPVGNYWFNVTLGGGGLCGASRVPFPASIFSYDGAPNDLPTDLGTPIVADCSDMTDFEPIVPRQMDPSTFDAAETQLDVNLTTAVTSRGNVFQWTVNGSAIDVQWDKPILQYVAEGNFSFPTEANVVELTARSGWNYVVINNIAGLVSDYQHGPICAWCQPPC